MATDPNGGNQDGGNNTATFVIPEEFKSEKSLENVKDYPSLFKGYVESQKTLGRAILLPDEKDAEPVKIEKMGKIYGKLGRPEKHDAYDPGDLPKLPKGVEWNDEKMAKFKKTAHELGLSNTQFKSLLGIYAHGVNDLVIDPAKVTQATEASLTKEFGENGYKRMVGLSHTAAKTLGGDRFLKFLDTTGLGNHEEMIRVFSKIGEEMTEHGSTEEGKLTGTKSKAEAVAEARKIIADKKHPYNDRRHPEHKKALDEVNALLSYQEEEE